jgi:DNA-binding FadR family transcriptional regulator
MRNNVATTLESDLRQLLRAAGDVNGRRPDAAEDGKGRTLSRRSLHGRIAHLIGEQIVRGALEPGVPLPNEAAWSARLKVSRTAMREAIKILAGKGLIESRPKTGTRVRPREFWNFLDPDVLAWQLAVGPVGPFVGNLFELRRVIEPAGAALAARRARAADLRRMDEAFRGMAAAGDDSERFAAPDMRFHQAILQASGNELIRSLGAMIETALIISFRLSNANPAGQGHSLPLHFAVFQAIREGKPDAARAAMVRLIGGAEKDVRRAIAAQERRAPR